MYQLCVYCGERATCIDHVRPRSRGGNDTDANRVPCCQICNSSKSNRLLTEWDIRRVLYGVSQDAKIFAEILDLTGAGSIADYKSTVTDQVLIASRLLRNRNKQALGFVIDQITASLAQINKVVRIDVERFPVSMTLGEMCRAEILPISYDAIRRARLRDKTFPEGEQSSQGLKYTIPQIQMWLKTRRYRKA